MPHYTVHIKESIDFILGMWPRGEVPGSNGGLEMEVRAQGQEQGIEGGTVGSK